MLEAAQKHKQIRRDLKHVPKIHCGGINSCKAFACQCCCKLKACGAAPCPAGTMGVKAVRLQHRALELSCPRQDAGIVPSLFSTVSHSCRCTPANTTLSNAGSRGRGKKRLNFHAVLFFGAGDRLCMEQGPPPAPPRFAGALRFVPWPGLWPNSVQPEPRQRGQSGRGTSGTGTAGTSGCGGRALSCSATQCTVPRGEHDAHCRKRCLRSYTWLLQLVGAEPSHGMLLPRAGEDRRGRQPMEKAVAQTPQMSRRAILRYYLAAL